jgi:oligopeptide transport system substrate-binding protein
MKCFYIIALIVTIALVASPFWLLESEDTSRFEGKIVQYITYPSKINSVDSVTCGDTMSASVQGGFYEGLYNYHYLKRPIEIVPQLADGMPVVAADGLTYTVKIKKGVKYFRNPCFGTESDGRHKTRTVTAHDFVLAYKRVGDFHVNTRLSLAFVQDKILGLSKYRQKTRNYAPGDFSRYEKEDLPGVVALDDYTVQFKLSKPFPQLQYILAMQCYAPMAHEVISYHLCTQDDGKGGRETIPIKERSTEVRTPEAVVGTGAFMLTDWVRGNKVIMVRNPDFRDVYYPSEGAPGDEERGLLKDAGKKLPFIDVKHMLCVQEPNPDWMLFQEKQRDYAWIPTRVYQTVISPSNELLASWKKEGITLLKNPQTALYWIAFNMEDKVVGKSKALRQGLYLSFDVDKYIEVVWNGRGIRGLNVIPSPLPGHKETGRGPYAHVDLSAARKKIEQAKKELVAAGVIKPGQDIPPITLDIGSRDEQAHRMAEFIMGEFRKIGVTVKTELNDWPTLQDKINNKRFQAVTLGWHADYPDAENFLQNFYSPNIDLNTNYVSYVNEEFDNLFEEANKYSNINDRVPLYAKMAQIIAEDVPVILLAEPITYTLLMPWTHNFKSHPIAYGLGKHTRIDVKARVEAGGRK